MRHLETAGERLGMSSALAWVESLLDGVAGPVGAAAAMPADTISLRVEAERTPFALDGMTLVTRGAWSDGDRVILHDACSSGFDLQLDTSGPVLFVDARYRPAARTRAANLLLRTRFRLLAAQTLVHYPVLWWAGLRGRAPLHASVLTVPPLGPVLLAGPGGVGKSTLLVSALAAGAVATSDNVCVSDGSSAHGLLEPVRVELPDRRGRRTTHGRREVTLADRVPGMVPERVIALRRGTARRTVAVPATPEAVVHSLVAGTYAAGELRRYWPFAATLALATGRGPAHPPVQQVAAGLAGALPCLEVRLGTERSPIALGALVDSGVGSA